MNISPPGTLFGISRGLARDEANTLGRFLVAGWTAQSGRPPAALETDLAQLELFFSPTSSGRRLREALAALGRIPVEPPPFLTDQIFLPWRRGYGLITPEGRITLSLLEDHAQDERVVIQIHEIAWACAVATDLYRSWGRKRLLQALGIQTGALRLPVIAFNLFLAVNRSIGEARAFPVPSSAEAESELSHLVGPVLDAFVDTLKPSRTRTEAFRLRGGWIVTETSRHLNDFVKFTGDAVWILNDRLSPLLRRLARELARDRRRSAAVLEEGFQAMVRAYSIARPRLAARGLAHERTAETSSTKQELLRAFAELKQNGAATR